MFHFFNRRPKPQPFYICPHCLHKSYSDNLWFRCSCPDAISEDAHKKFVNTYDARADIMITALTPKTSDSTPATEDVGDSMLGVDTSADATASTPPKSDTYSSKPATPVDERTFRKFALRMGIDIDRPRRGFTSCDCVKSVKAAIDKGCFKYQGKVKINSRTNEVILPQSTLCEYCSSYVGHRFVCPECLEEITPDFADTQTIISFAGLQTNGKTEYIRALLSIVQQEWFSNCFPEWSITFDSVTLKELLDSRDDTVDTVANLANRGTKLSTKPKPSVITFTHNASSRKYSFFLYDASGELFRRDVNLRKLRENAIQLSYTEYMLVMISKNRISQLLGKSTDAVDRHSDTTNNEFINNITANMARCLEYYGGYTEDGARKKVKSIPTALCIAKIDLVEDSKHETFMLNSLANNDLSQDYIVDYYRTILQNSDAIKQTMENKWNMAPFVNVMNTSFNSNLFVTLSNVKKHPVKTKGNVEGLGGYYTYTNVLDPFMWIVGQEIEDIRIKYTQAFGNYRDVLSSTKPADGTRKGTSTEGLD